MIYREKRIKAGEFLEVEIYPITPLERSKSRKRKLKESRKEQKNLNDKNAKKKLRRLINHNFTERDLVVHLTYTDKTLPTSEDEAKKDVKNFIRRVKRKRQKAGLPEVKYIAVFEYVNYDPQNKDKRKKVRMHHHIIMSAMDRDELEKLWDKGRCNADRLQADEKGFESLANYISKNPKGSKRYSRSKNIVEPEIQINDSKWTRRKVMQVSQCPEDRELFEKLYPGWTFTQCSVEVNEINAGFYIELKMRGTG